MKTMITTVALGVSILSTQALAQTPPPATQAPPAQVQTPQGGWTQGPQTRDQAKQG